MVQCVEVVLGGGILSLEIVEKTIFKKWMLSIGCWEVKLIELLNFKWIEDAILFYQSFLAGFAAVLSMF